MIHFLFVLYVEDNGMNTFFPERREFQLNLKENCKNNNGIWKNILMNIYTCIIY